MPRNTKDTDVRKEYENQLLEKEKYQFHCYCEEAKIETKRVAFLAYKLLDEKNDESSKVVKNVNNESYKAIENNGKKILKRKSDSQPELLETKHQKRI